MKRLQFKLELKPKIPKKEFMQMSYADILDDDRHFVITVNNEVYFDDPYFPIREFVRYAIHWTEKDFVYETEDDYQNPLSAFINHEHGWKMRSVWQKFECEDIFTFEEVERFLKEIVAQVIE